MVLPAELRVDAARPHLVAPWGSKLVDRVTIADILETRDGEDEPLLLAASVALDLLSRT